MSSERTHHWSTSTMGQVIEVTKGVMKFLILMWTKLCRELFIFHFLCWSKDVKTVAPQTLGWFGSLIVAFFSIFCVDLRFDERVTELLGVVLLSEWTPPFHHRFTDPVWKESLQLYTISCTSCGYISPQLWYRKPVWRTTLPFRCSDLQR